jgi:phosphoglycolate phosphatase-like HAD superfamily hydrolase
MDRNKLKLLITDLDGTLTNLDINWNQIREIIRGMLKTSHPLKPLATSIPEAARGDVNLIREAYEVIEDYEYKAALKAKQDIKLIEFLKRVKCLGFKVALVTLQARKPAIKALEKLGVLKYFDGVITRDDSIYREEQLRIVLNRFKAKPEETVFIGDTVWDLEAGRKLKLKTFIIGENRDEDYKLKNITELLNKIT